MAHRWIINVKQPKKREFLLCTKHKHIKDEWVSAIQALITHYDTQDQPPDLSLSSSLSSYISRSSSHPTLQGMDANPTEGAEEMVTEAVGQGENSTSGIYWKRYK